MSFEELPDLPTHPLKEAGETKRSTIFFKCIGYLADLCRGIMRRLRGAAEQWRCIMTMLPFA